MLLRSSLANQEAVQAKTGGKKAAERVGKRKGKNCSVCSFYASPEQIFINLGITVLGCI